MIRYPFLLTLLFISSSSAIELTKNLIMDMSKTYGYTIGQTYTVDFIKNKYPNLNNQIFIAKSEFDMSYLDSIDNIDSILNSKAKDAWSNIKKDIKNKIPKNINLENFTETDARNFLKEVKLRAKGDIESPIIETLLMFNPTYQKYPRKELSDGFFKKYISDGNFKAKGVKFSIKVPKSYKSKEANRPNKYECHYGNS